MTHDTDAALIAEGRSMAYGAQLARSARTVPDRVAIRFGATELSYAELDTRVNQLAHALAGLGVGAGDRVAILMRNRVEYVESVFAVCRLGAVVVPVNFRLVAAEVGYLIADSGARALIVDADLAPVAAEAGTPEAVLVTDGGESAIEGALPYAATVSAASTEPVRVSVAEGDPAFIMYTSGTTGRPKGAVLSHLNVTMGGMLQELVSEPMATEGVVLIGVPIFHIAGLVITVRSLYACATVVIYDRPSFHPAEVVELLERARITSCFFVPAQWAAICAVPGVADRDMALTSISWGAATATPSVLRAMESTFPNAPAACAFGQTEMSPVTCVLRGGDAVHKMGSIGTPLPGIEVRIVDDDGEEVPDGEVGEIVYRGPTLMLGYWNKPIETAEAFRGGWFHSGDLVRRDEDGFLWVVDRKKDMIISGGENIYCAEVEAAIDAHPGVAEVAVIGQDDQQWGQIPLAVIVPVDAAEPPTVESLRAHCADLLAPYKHPRAVRIVDALPRNASGKVQKFVLRAQ